MKHITRDMAADVLNQLGSRFDTHMVERRCLRLYTVATANEVLEFRNTQDTLHQFSAQFGRWIDSAFRGQIRQTQKVRTENLGGELSLNQEWEKVNPSVSVE